MLKETLKGNFGNGQERIDKYKELGVNGTEVQNMVNVLKDNSTVYVRNDKIKGYEYGVKNYTVTQNEIPKKDDSNVTPVNQGNNNQLSVDPNGGNQTTPATVDIKNQGYWGSQSGVGGDGVVDFSHNVTTPNTSVVNNGLPSIQTNNNQPSLPGIGDDITPGSFQPNLTSFGVGQANNGINTPNYWQNFVDSTNK